MSEVEEGALEEGGEDAAAPEEAAPEETEVSTDEPAEPAEEEGEDLE